MGATTTPKLLMLLFPDYTGGGIRKSGFSSLPEHFLLYLTSVFLLQLSTASANASTG